MAFYLKLEKDGVDLYPRLFEAMERPEIYDTNRVRFELMRRLGYFVTESSEHNAEYCPYLIPRGKEMIAKFDVQLDEYLYRCDGIVDEFERMKDFGRNETPIEVHASHEYGSTIIHSMVTGKPSVVYGNMQNRGAISNLPDTAIAEIPTLVDRNGLQFTTVGELPPELVGYMQPHITQQELFIRAALEGRRDHVYQAAMYDPLTAATLPLDKIVEMCDELIAAHGDLLPPLDTKKTRVPGSRKHFSAVDPKEFRRSWNEAQKGKAEGFIKKWNVLGAFASPTKGEVSLDQRTPFEDDFLKQGDGSVDLKAAWQAGGKALNWIPVTADAKGQVVLDGYLGQVEWAVGYAYAEIESIHARDSVLRFGSDDGIRIWLNGQQVCSHEVTRGYKAGSDSQAVHLNSGINKILLKIDNYQYGWSFGLEVPKANF